MGESSERTPALEDLRRGVDRNDEVARRIDELVERRHRDGRLASAVAWGRVGSAFRATNPTSSFRAVRIEQVLDDVSRRCLPEVVDPGRARTVERVVHVLSEAHLIGGHRSMALRWVRLDAPRVGSFVVTRPGLDDPVLHRAAAGAGGTVEVLSGGLIDRARRLRVLASEHDVVVCHTHNDDTVPAMAFGGDYGGPPVVLVNHADHVFFLGVGNVSTIANLRWTGAEFAERARGFARRAFCDLPIPLDEVDRDRSRRAAKEELGIDPDRVVALTLARPKKYLPSPLQPGFLEVVEPLLDEDGPLLVACGPSSEDPGWGDVAARAGGRLRVEGPVADPRTHLDAADIYLDSLPFSSNTSMLEAAVRGTPVVTYRPYGEFQRLLGSDGVLDEVVLAPTTLDEYVAAVRNLVADERSRGELGERTASAVRREHGKDAWRDAMEAVYAHALAAEPIRERVCGDVDGAGAAHDYATALLGIESRTPLLWSILTAAEDMDTRDRRSVRLRSSLVRGWQRVRPSAERSGPAGASVLVASGSRRSPST